MARGQRQLVFGTLSRRGLCCVPFCLCCTRNRWMTSPCVTLSSHHTFADSTQMQKSCSTDQIGTTISAMQTCISDIKSYIITANKLQLNDDKTESLLIKSNRTSFRDTAPCLVYGSGSLTFPSQIRQKTSVSHSSGNVHGQAYRLCLQSCIP